MQFRTAFSMELLELACLLGSSMGPDHQIEATCVVFEVCDAEELEKDIYLLALFMRSLHMYGFENLYFSMILSVLVFVISVRAYLGWKIGFSIDQCRSRATKSDMGITVDITRVPSSVVIMSLDRYKICEIFCTNTRITVYFGDVGQI